MKQNNSMFIQIQIFLKIDIRLTIYLKILTKSSFRTEERKLPNYFHIEIKHYF